MANTKENKGLEVNFDTMTVAELKAYAAKTTAEKVAAEEKAKATQEGAAKEISTLKKKLTETKEAASGDVIITYEDEKYRVVGSSFSLPNSMTGGKNKSVKAEELKDDADLVKKLIESESGILIKVEK